MHLQMDKAYYLISCAGGYNMYNPVFINFIDIQFFSPSYGDVFMLKSLLDHNRWLEFLDSKLNNEYISKKEKEHFSSFIIEKRYLSIATKIVNNEYCFSHPVKHVISKNHSDKKRVIYNYNDEEMYILKFIAYQLYEYDYLFSNNLYSFRKNVGVKNAINALKRASNLPNMYGYKLDISNYFNSVDIDLLLNYLKNDIEEDIYEFIKALLCDKYVLYNNELIEEQKGVMAGSPISAFLANYYIRDIDCFFSKQSAMYLRYADDIIVFANSQNELLFYQSKIKELLITHKLTINQEKESFYQPSERFEFLGFAFIGDSITISKHSQDKLKGKIRRSIRGIRRWMLKKNIQPEIALKGIIRKYNSLLLGVTSEEKSWKYWYFPAINRTNELNEIDLYFQEELRYLVTGKHNKANYDKISYEKLKECGYKSLVHEYYKFIEKNKRG